MTETPFVNPIDVIVDLLTAALPGFETMFVKGRDAVGIRGGLPIRAELSAETVMFPVMTSPRFAHPDDVDRSILAALAGDYATGPEINIAKARERKRVERELEPVVEHVTAHVRGLGIAALGLGPVMAAERAEAERRGRATGYAEGRDAGKREGYDAGVRSIVRILLQSDAAIGDAVDEIRASWEGDDDE